MTRRLGLWAAVGVVLLGASLVAAEILSSTPTTFAPAEQERSGMAPYAVVTADVDLDGRVDIVVANNESNDVTVLYATEEGTFDSVNYAADSGPSGVQVADMNNDGRLDIVVSHNTANSVLTLLQNSDHPRDFEASVPQETDEGPEGVVVADFNGDGIRDAATPNLFSTDGTVSVLIGVGDGTFKPRVLPPLVPGPNDSGDYLTVVECPAEDPECEDFIGSPMALVAANVDSGAPLDILVANVDGDNVALLPGAGDGTFGTPSNFEVGPAPVSIAAGDLNIDGFVDLVTADEEDGTISLLFGAGDGTFQIFGFDVNLDSFPTAVRIWDLNMDGRPDVAVANSSGDADGVTVMRGIGVSSPSAFAFETAENFPIDLLSPNPFGVAIGDLDGDFRPDMATANIDVGEEDEGVSVFRNTGNLLVGDANTDSVVNEEDIPQALEEVFDGDGVIVIQVAGGSLASGPGADGNGDTVVSAADLLAIAKEIANNDSASAGT